MPSAPSFNFGSASSARSSVRDAIESYRRAQYLVAGSTLAATNDDDVFDDDDEEALHGLQDEQILEEDEGESLGIAVPGRAREDSFTGLRWDEDYDSVQSSPATPSILRPAGWRPQPNRSQTVTQGSYGIARTPTSYLEIPGGPPSIVRRPSEDTPLLKKSVSFSTLAQPQRPTDVSSPTKGAEPIEEESITSGPPRRRLSSASAMSAARHHRGGQSTYGQTLFNSIAILLGIGMLSEPLAFAYSGWTIGTFLILAYGYVACYTAKILARVILADSRLRSYSDIGKKAFGPKVMPFISVMFCLELFAVSVVLITLYGDSLHSLIPDVSSNSFKVWGLIILIPTVFLPLSLLSYTSILGIISTISMVLVIFIDGFSKKEAPGSLFSPAPTEVAVTNVKELGMAFGLFMAGFSGHAVIPSLARDMADPTQFESMIDWAFLVATVIYTAIGYAGYIMFGRDVSDEISVDLLRTPGYNPLLNQLCLWMLVLSPLSKFALNTQPLNATLEILLGIDTPISSPEALVDKPDGLSAVPSGSRFSWKRALGIIQRILLTSFAVFVSILVPEFSAVMAILGAFSAFVLSIVGPVYAKYMIEGECTAFDKVIIVVGIVMAIWGTFAALTN